MTLDSLVLINQKNYTIYGDLVVTGMVIIIRSKLTVKGKLKIVKNPKLNNQVRFVDSDITAYLINSGVDILANDGQIKAKYGISCANIYGSASLFSSKGAILINGNSHVKTVDARAYIVRGSNESDKIICTNLIYIWGNSNSKAMTANKIFIEGDTNFGGYSITAQKVVIEGKIRECFSSSVPIRKSC